MAHEKCWPQDPMKSKFYLIFYALFLCWTCQGFAVEQSKVSDLEALKKLLGPVQSLKAKFEQKLINEQGKVLESAQGSMILKKPGRFVWKVEGLDPKWVVSDGKKVWDYDKELAQVTVYALAKGESRAPIFFLTGDVETLNKDFRVKKLNIVSKHSDLYFELTPIPQNEADSSFQSIKIGFKNKLLHELELKDQLGQLSRFTFSQVVLNGAVDDAVFKFTPSKGVDVVEQ